MESGRLQPRAGDLLELILVASQAARRSTRLLECVCAAKPNFTPDRVVSLVLDVRPGIIPASFSETAVTASSESKHAECVHPIQGGAAADQFSFVSYTEAAAI